MKLTRSLLLVISALALGTGVAFAREELSLTEPGTGQDLMSGYEVTSEGDVISSERYSEPNSSGALALEESSIPSSSSVESSNPGSDVLALAPGEYLIYEETIVMVPSGDSEMPQG